MEKWLVDFLEIVPPGNRQISQKLNWNCERKWDFMHGGEGGGL